MKTTYHMSLSISGALRRPKDFIGCITWDGRLLMTAREVKQFLEYQQSLGREVLPFSECEGFDYVTGCPGHTEADTGLTV